MRVKGVHSCLFLLSLYSSLMLKKFIKLILPNTSSNQAVTLRKTPRDQHNVSRRDISQSAIKVLYRLNRSGHQAFLVGGGVRDILLGVQPKDFDIATSATPEEVKALFGNCRLIGRRFRLAHIRFGREIIEVATFRAGHQQASTDNKRASTSHQGQILRDNVYGNRQEDALRRDFTINALYYSVEDFSIYDYTGGLQDLAQRTLRLIGDPAIRYREDPVRMLRAARFAAKLDFQLEEKTAAPIAELGPLLLNIPAARLFEEVLKLFLSGCGLATFDHLRQLGLFQFLFPRTDELLNAEVAYAGKLVRVALANTDERINSDKPVTPAFLYAALLWPVLTRSRQFHLDQGLSATEAFHTACQEVIGQQIKHTSLPRRFSQPMREIWELQHALCAKKAKKAPVLVERPRFRAAYDFVLLREASGEDLAGAGDWWTTYQRENPVVQVTGGSSKSSKKSSRSRYQRNRSTK